LAQSSLSARKTSVELLERICTNGEYSSEVIQAELQKSNLSQKDRSLVLELVNGTLRWQGQLDWILLQYFHGNFEKSPHMLKRILEVSLYQIRFLDRVPEYAAVSEGVQIAKNAGGQRWGKLVNAVLRNYQRSSNSIKFPTVESDPVLAISIQHSHPKWLVQRWLERYGLERTIQFCEHNNRRHEITLRTNLKKISRQSLLKELKASGIQAQPSKYFDDFIKISKPQELTKLRLFKEGLFAIQDESTALATQLLALREGDTVLDMCAAPGGKTCHIGQLVGGEGKVTAVDIKSNRLNLLKENATRLGVKSIQALVGNAAEIDLPKVDKILLDAPCSGLGVLSKRADLRWKRKQHDILNIRKIQKKLLKNAARLLKQKGTLVYSTCTLEPEENEELIEEFLKEHAEFRIGLDSESLHKTFSTPKGYWTSVPYEHKMDGVFAVKLIKSN